MSQYPKGEVGANGLTATALPSEAGASDESPPCGSVSAFAGDNDPYWEYEEDDCWQCGGDGSVYGCSWDWQCDTWDGDSCLCTRACDICHPPKPNPELQAVLTDALARATGGAA